MSYWSTNPPLKPSTKTALNLEGRRTVILVLVKSLHETSY